MEKRYEVTGSLRAGSEAWLAMVLGKLKSAGMEDIQVIPVSEEGEAVEAPTELPAAAPEAPTDIAA